MARKRKRNKADREKKPVYKRWWFIALVVIIIIGAFGGDDEDSSEVADEPDTEDIVEEVEAEAEEPEDEEPEVEEEPDPEEVEDNETETEDDESQDSELLDEINEAIAEYMQENKGFALGTLDENGEPTEDGEPNYDFAWSLYVHKLTYNGNDLEMQTDAGFLDLSDVEKTEIANKAQNIANSVIGGYEDWELSQYQERKFLTVLNGENALGHSRAFDVTDFKWYD